MCCRKLGEKNMNMQAMLKQAQKLQKDMMNAKNEIDKMEFSNETSFVKVTHQSQEAIQEQFEDEGEYSYITREIRKNNN